jgi:hypothetical protein
LYVDQMNFNNCFASGKKHLFFLCNNVIIS